MNDRRKLPPSQGGRQKRISKMSLDRNTGQPFFKIGTRDFGLDTGDENAGDHC